MTKSQSSSKDKISQWQSHKMRQPIIARWQEIWTVVEARDQHNKTSSLR